MKTTIAIIAAYFLGIATLYTYNNLPKFSSKNSPDSIESELINAPLKKEEQDDFQTYQKNFENLSEVDVMGSLPPKYGDDITFNLPKEWQVKTFSNSLAVGPQSILNQLSQSETPITSSELMSNTNLPLLIESTKTPQKDFLNIFAEVSSIATQNLLTSQDLKTMYIVTFNQDLQIAKKGEKWHIIDLPSDTKIYRFILTDERYIPVFKQILSSVSFK